MVSDHENIPSDATAYRCRAVVKDVVFAASDSEDLLAILSRLDEFILSLYALGLHGEW